MSHEKKVDENNIVGKLEKLSFEICQTEERLKILREKLKPVINPSRSYPSCGEDCEKSKEQSYIMDQIEMHIGRVIIIRQVINELVDGIDLP